MPSVNVYVSGKVDSFAEISPRRITLAGRSGKSIRTSVTILPRPEFPFRIVGVQAQKGKHIDFQLKENPAAALGGYVLMVENRREQPGRFWDRIDLKTDSSIQPLIHIPVYGNITRESPREQKPDEKL